MRHHTNQDTLHARTQQLMQGPLKHIKAAALAAALLPLASVAAKPAEAQTVKCASGGVCGTIFDDANMNGTFDAGETGIEGVKIVVCQVCDGNDDIATESGPGGFYYVFVPEGLTTISVQIPTGTQASPTDSGDGFGSSVASAPGNGSPTNFGFSSTPVQGPGTGTPGYWKNHPEAWPQTTISVGGMTYTREKAIEWLGKVGKDKTTTLFSSLVSAILNGLVHNDTTCVDKTIALAHAWMTKHPVGSGVLASSAAWAEGEPLHIILDNYNNGRLCAPHRN